LVIDNPLVDITLEVQDDSLLKKFDLTLGSASCCDDDLDELIQTCLDTQGHIVTPGGCGTNTARAASFSLRRANIEKKIVYFGAVGIDTAGTYLENCCK
jgi:sugar/nucleoside kinase (ribokinase family)